MFVFNKYPVLTDGCLDLRVEREFDGDPPRGWAPSYDFRVDLHGSSQRVGSSQIILGQVQLGERSFVQVVSEAREARADVRGRSWGIGRANRIGDRGSVIAEVAQHATNHSAKVACRRPTAGGGDRGLNDVRGELRELRDQRRRFDPNVAK